MDKYEQIATLIKEIEEMQGNTIEVNNDPASTIYDSDGTLKIIRFGGLTLIDALIYVEIDHKRVRKQLESKINSHPFDFNKFTKL